MIFNQLGYIVTFVCACVIFHLKIISKFLIVLIFRRSVEDVTNMTKAKPPYSYVALIAMAIQVNKLLNPLLNIYLKFNDI